MTQRHTAWTNRFDHILAEIECGRIGTAVPVFAGMLDAVAEDEGQVQLCRAQLLRHPLYGALSGAAAQAAVAELGFMRATETRNRLFQDALKNSSGSNRRTHIFAQGQGAEGETFDVILAPSLADDHGTHTLLAMIRAILPRLATNGRLILSAFTPHHLGLGWQRVCFGRSINCHDEASFAALAEALGLSAATFRDGSGNLIWAEFRPKIHITEEGKEDGYCDPYPCDCRRRSGSFYAPVPGPAAAYAGLCHGLAGG